MKDLKQPCGSRLMRADIGAIHVARVPRAHCEELYISASAPDGAPAAASADAAAIYAQIAALLDEQESTVVQERVYGSLAVRAQAQAARAEALAGSSAFGAVPPTYLQGMPCCEEGLAGVHICAVSGADVEPIVHERDPLGHCVRTPEVRFAYLSGLAGTRPDVPMAAEGQADAMFGLANRVLNEQGFVYRDVIRTWIYIADILAWYDEFNAVRNAAYTRFGLLGAGDDYLPASTGIQARPSGQLELTMDLVALQAAPGAEVTTDRLHNPLQNEAYAYGSAFARAMEVVWGGARTVYVSGTASIDEFGNTIYLDDIDAQIQRTVCNIEALIGTRGLRLDDICQATVFLKDAAYGDRFREVCAGTSFAEIGVCMVADVCREDLLFEIDAVAAGPA